MISMANILSTQQLPLNLGYITAYEREIFLISSCNIEAVKMLEQFNIWPNKIMVIYGLKSSGKTHLAHVWQKMTGAILINGSELNEKHLENIAINNEAVIIDDADNATDARLLFHLYNLCRENNRYLLLTAKTRPAHWGIELKDLSSRLKSVSVAGLSAPDDELLTAILTKIFVDRQLYIGSDILKYVVIRIERSFDAINKFADLADNLSLANKKNITIPLARQVLVKMQNLNKTTDV